MKRRIGLSVIACPPCRFKSLVIAALLAGSAGVLLSQHSASAADEKPAPVETSAGWQKYEGNPVMGGQYGTCFDISVLHEGGTYRMWLSWRPKAAVALVESKDGIHWSDPPQIVLGPRKESGWEDDINRPCVLKRDGAYHMWYTGQASGHSWIGYATSPDGVTWKRMSDKPVLSFDQPWEKNTAVMCPSVIWDESTRLFSMWYSGGEQNEPDAIGHAVSSDGLNWKKNGGNPVFLPDPANAWEKHKVTGCQVQKRGDWHVMFYIGFEDEPTARICLARSRDGITDWQRHPANPIIFPGRDKWDHDACYKPYAIFDGTKWLLWYNGRHGGLEQIGVVFHEGEDLGFAPPSAVAHAAASHLTDAQRQVLAAPVRADVDDRFSFSFPAGPQFTPEEKQAQYEAGRSVLPVVLDAFGTGAPSVTIAPVDYRFGAESWGPDGPIYPLEFSGLRRDPANTFLIDASGATFWFDLPDDQAPTAHFCIGFKQCRNVIFRGATLDRGTRGHVEGRITAFDFEGNRIQLELSPGISLPPKFSGELEQRVVPFKADGTFCAPLYALQAGGTRLKYRKITADSVENRCWVEMLDPTLLQTVRDSAWLDRYGERGVLRVGDGLSCVYSVAAAVELVRSENLTMDGITVHIPKAGCAEWGGDGGHLWKNCHFGPRPGTSQWQGAEGFLFCATRHGPVLDHVAVRHTADDTANFHGYWGFIESLSGNRVAFANSGEFDRTVMKDAVAGDRLLFHDKTTGKQLGTATITGIEGRTFLLDRSVDAFANAIVEFPDHACAGWTVQNCAFQDDYQRLLVQSGPGTVRDCTFTRQGSSLELNSVMPYVEGGIPRDILIANNQFTEVAPVPRGSAISVYAHTFQRENAPPLGNIRVTGNHFLDCGERTVALDGVEDGVMADNRVERRQTPH